VSLPHAASRLISLSLFIRSLPIELGGRNAYLAVISVLNKKIFFHDATGRCATAAAAACRVSVCLHRTVMNFLDKVVAIFTKEDAGGGGVRVLANEQEEEEESEEERESSEASRSSSSSTASLEMMDRVSVHRGTTRRRRRLKPPKRYGERTIHAEDDSDSTTDSDSLYDESSSDDEYARLDYDGHFLARDRHFRFVTPDYCEKKKNWDPIRQCYQLFRAYAPLPRTTHHRPFSSRELVGLEYLLRETGREKLDSMQFPCITAPEMPGLAYTRRLPAMLGRQPPPENTFIVSRICDHVYGHVIECALLDGVCAEQMPINVMHEARDCYRERKLDAFPLCEELSCLTETLVADGDRFCPFSVVIYTRRDGKFFQMCQHLMDQNTVVNYEKHGEFVKQIPLSYHLVHYLCGHLLLGSADGSRGAGLSGRLGSPEERGRAEKREEEKIRTIEVEGYDQWIAVSVSLLDIWYTIPASTNNNNNNNENSNSTVISSLHI
jgi:hypothetical protein